MDRREQKKLAAKNEKNLRAQRRERDGVEEKPEEAEALKQKDAAANVYDTFDMRVDRHWSDKKLEEMTDRDWRIFREDFNISYKDIRVVSVVGGQPIEEQGFKLRQGCEIVIATPGRLRDCLETRYVVLNQCNYVVLDEADRMIDMGFKPQVVGLLESMPSNNLKPENEDEELDERKIYRTTSMFSTTMHPAVECLARMYLRYPVVKSADSLARQLDKSVYRLTNLHCGKTQDQREISLEGFRNKRFICLVATDVAGCGIDIPDVAHVINFDMPTKIEMYTHRIG